MKLLFVENRYATWIYESISIELIKLGHQVHWLVQNPIFLPSIGDAYIIPFPVSEDEVIAEENYEWLAKTDRGVLHFGGDCLHYGYYDGKIKSYLDKIKPDVVFGEATEFHELLTIKRCKEQGIPYLSPNVTRYPADRLAFLTYDTLEPVFGDGDQLSNADADRLVENIRSRKLIPSYMRAVQSNPNYLVIIRLIDKARIAWGWVRGERFVTPSPRRKFGLNEAQRVSKVRWEKHANKNWMRWKKLLQSGRPWVLYALQMQPEGNIDVWGAPWNDQAELVRRAAKSLESMGVTLVVKPNPKSKYELTPALNTIVEVTPNVIGLPHGVPMSEVFPCASMVMAVTGTVLMECIFSDKPVAVLGEHCMANYPGVTKIVEPDKVVDVLRKVIHGDYVVASAHEKRELLQKLYATSYSATIWDPIGSPNAGTEENFISLSRAFNDVISNIKA